MNAPKELVKTTEDSLIYIIRGQRVMLDEDLARMYGVDTKVLNQAVKRNHARFPAEFMFQLSEKEYDTLRSQSVTSNEEDTDRKRPTATPGEETKSLRSQNATSKGRGGRRYMPYVFTEHGTVMLASVLNSPKAVHASIQVVKAFVRLRELMIANKNLSKKLDELEEKYDKQFAVIFDAVRRLMEPVKPTGERKRLGYKRKDEN